jgi:uncharacterized Zn finger protein
MTALPITEAFVRQHSTAESFARGQAYFHEGAVGVIVRRADTVQAEVAGSLPEPYRVTLIIPGTDEVHARCTCPYDWGGWCKHIVATSLAILHHPESVDERPTLPCLLAPLDRDALEVLLLQLAESDPSLVDVMEAQIALLPGASSMTETMHGASGEPQMQPVGPAMSPSAAGIPNSTRAVPPVPVPSVTIAGVRRELHAV